VQHARQSAARWREGPIRSRTKTQAGTTFSFSLNEQTTVRFSFIETLGKTGTAHSCLAKLHKNLRHTSCNNPTTAGTLTFAGHRGTNDITFTGRISRTDTLKPGRYELIITAINSTGQRSAPVSLSFTIVR
jgi:hypothetical protein